MTDNKDRNRVIRLIREALRNLNNKEDQELFRKTVGPSLKDQRPTFKRKSTKKRRDDRRASPIQRGRGHPPSYEEETIQAFVAMPFNPVFLPVWQVIKKACEANNIIPCRVDQLLQRDNIYETIEKEIENSDLVIVDFSGDVNLDVPNPNVVTEAKHAKDKGKPVTILTQSTNALPFDWKQYRAIIYENDKKGLKYLMENLTEVLEGLVKRLFML